MTNQIKATDNIGNLFTTYPNLRTFFISKGMHCVGCEIVEFETIEESCISHNIANVEQFIKTLNELISTES